MSHPAIPLADGPWLFQPVEFTAIAFFSVSGAPFGLELLINLIGGRVALLIIVSTQLIWLVLVVLTMLNMNGMM